MKINFLILLSLLLFQSFTNAQSSDGITDKIKKVENGLVAPVYIKGDPTWTIEERMEHYGVPGVSIAVINDGKIEWTKTYGIMDKETKSPVTKETLFQAASISKPISAYAALRLVEQNTIQLNEDINTYLKSWKLPDSEFTKEKKVTLKHLLNHSAGTTVHGFWGYSPGLPVPTLVQLLNGKSPANSRAITVDKTPEESFRYSGGGYCVMQQMLIDVEGKPFPQIMDQQVLKPLGMNNSTYNQPLQKEQLKMAATGYLPDGTMTKGKRHTYPEMAAAGLWTTAEDLAKFAINIQQSLKGKNNLVLSQKMTNEMLTPFVEDHIGLGIFLNKYKAEIYFGHGGWNEGFSSELLAHKDKGYGVAILTNSNHPPFISELIRSIAMTYEWDEYAPIYQPIKIDDKEAEKISGRYLINKNEIMQVYQEGTQLYTKGIGTTPKELIKIADNTYIKRDRNRHIQFKRNAENSKMEAHFINWPNGKTLWTSPKMKDDEKIPLEYLAAGNFEKALADYQVLIEKNPKDRDINEGTLNRIGYGFLNEGQAELAKSLFKINVILYPKSTNVYDSYGDGLLAVGDTINALINFEKTLAMDASFQGLVNKINGLDGRYNLLKGTDSLSKEVILFPLSFAPEINYDGFEDIAFLKGWAKEESPEFWSYVFAWNINQKVDLTEKELKKDMQLYFDGLMKVVNKDKDFVVPKTVADFHKKEGSNNYVGTIRLHDSFHTKKTITLNVTVEKLFCNQKNKTLILCRFSPKAFGAEVWDKMEGIKLRTDICDF